MPKKVTLPPEAIEFFRKQGKIGGKRSLETMTPEQRSERARTAVAAREAKRVDVRAPAKSGKKAVPDR
jgi:hypothetical protein